MILFFKALHVVGFVSWFAGLFYLVRMFVYDVESSEKQEPKKSILKSQFNLMENRVYKIICTPALVVTFIGGIGMVVNNPGYLQLGWMHSKLFLLLLLVVYHFYCGRLIPRLEAGENPMTPFQFRLFNEFPTLFLVLISFIAVLGKAGTLNYAKLFLGLIIFIALLMLGAKAYKRSRERKL